jgi:hypothetical protein
MQIRILLPLLLAAALVACGEKSKPAETPKPAAPADTAPPSPAVAVHPPTPPTPPKTFEDSIHDEFSYEAVKIPTRVSDSIIRANKMDPRRIEKAMTAYLHHQDTLARQALAARHGLTLDSLDRILKRQVKSER